MNVKTKIPPKILWQRMGRIKTGDTAGGPGGIGIKLEKVIK